MEKGIVTPIVEGFNIDEEFLYNKHYLYIKGYAAGKGLKYTLAALPLARRLHDGQYRKGTIMINGKEYRLPYLLHCLKVCSTLISCSLPLSHEEEDILLSAAILHDTFEDCPSKLPKNGRELYEDYGFLKEVYDIIKLLSKHTGASEEELNIYFNDIKRNKFALLIKLADRSHNVEDLYNMVDVTGNKNLARLEKYVKETRTWIYPLSSYAKANYPEISNGVTILKAKIVSLTEATETIVELYEDELKKKDEEIASLKKQLEELQNK